MAPKAGPSVQGVVDFAHDREYVPLAQAGMA